MSSGQGDVVKQQVAAHWNRRAPSFDEGFGHGISTPAERAAWDRILDLVLCGRSGLVTLDAGCGTGFLSFELAARGHDVTGVDFAPAAFEAGLREDLVVQRLQALVEDGVFVSDAAARDEVLAREQKLTKSRIRNHGGL